MFRVQPHQPKTLLWWFQNRSKINSDPSYQRRGSLWNRQKKAQLIDSVLNEYDIPKIYLADFNYANTILNEARTPYAVIDGKQRLETFFDFFEGKVSLDKEFVFIENPALDLKLLSYADLKSKFPKVAQKFDRYIPAVMSVITDDEGKVDEMFVRLNSGLPIMAAEKRNAMKGPIPRLIRKLASHDFFKKKISFSTKRMQEYNTVAKIILIESRGRFVDTKANNLNRLVKDNENREFEEFAELHSTIVSVLDAMAVLFRDQDSVLSSEGRIPVFYWLAKNNSDLEHFRPFLKQFQRDVKENNSTALETPAKADPELSSYYQMDRTTNDQGSLSGRYEILQKRFKKFVSKRK